MCMKDTRIFATFLSFILKSTKGITLKSLLCLMFVFISIGQLKSQINYGDDAQKMLAILKYYNKYPYAKYSNGKIEYIECCEDDRFAVDFKKYISYCDYYIMDNDEKYASLIRKYINISIEELVQTYKSLPHTIVIDNYYFNDKFDVYSELYLSKDRYATSKSKKVVLSRFPLSIRNKIELKKKEMSLKEKERNQIEEEKRKIEKQKKSEIISKIYDLELYDKSAYDSLANELPDGIRNYFKWNTPSFQELEDGDIKKYRYTNIFNVHYKLEKQKVVKMTQYKAKDVRTVINQVVEVSNLSGGDKEPTLFDVVLRIPTIKIEGYEVMTEASFPNVKIDYAKGLTIVKIRSGKVEFKSFLPDEDIQEKLKSKLKGEPRGKYSIRYEVGNVAGKEFISTELYH